MSSERQSNIELLRIVSMMMVLIVHIDGASLGLPQVFGNVDSLTGCDVWKLAVESVAIIGVNCFTMISGYFGIKLRMRSVCSYLFECIFYSVGIFTVGCIVFPERFTASEWFESWLVLSHTDLWYVPAYFGLMLLSPLLNAGVSSISRGRFELVLGLFVTFNLWCGWWWGAAFNPTGYTLTQLILIYLIGRYAGMYGAVLSRKMAAVLYIASVVAIFISAIYMKSTQAFAYNSPFVMAAAIACFLWFKDLQIQSKSINRVAKSVFAVYLIHKAPMIWGGFMRPLVIKLWESNSLAAFSLYAVVIVVAAYAVAMVADFVRRGMWRLLQASFQKEIFGKN